MSDKITDMLKKVRQIEIRTNRQVSDALAGAYHSIFKGRGMEFEEALALATELGYAEADPTADVEGLDAGRKVAIMATSAFHSQVKF